MSSTRHDRSSQDDAPGRHRRTTVGDVVAYVGATCRDHLARTGGALPAGSGTAPVDWGNAALLGLAVLAIALLVLAGCIGAFAVVLGGRLYAVLPALLLATIGFAFTRNLIVSVVKPRTVRENVVAAIVGGLLAALAIGWVQGAAVVLWAYQPDIDAARLKAVEQEYAPSIRDLEERKLALQTALEVPVPVQVGGDAEVVRLQRLLDAKYAELTTAEDALVCERTGRCGTAAGQGGGYRERKAKVDRLVKERDALTVTRDAAVSDARIRGQKEQALRDRAALEQVQADLTARLDERTRRAGHVDVGDHALPEQVARLGVLAGLPTARPIAWTWGAVVLISVLLQMSPIVLKLVCGPSPSDDAARGAEHRRHDGPGSSSTDRVAPLPRPVTIPLQATADTK